LVRTANHAAGSLRSQGFIECRRALTRGQATALFPFKVFFTLGRMGSQTGYRPFRVLLHLWDHGLLQLAVFWKYSFSGGLNSINVSEQE